MAFPAFLQSRAARRGAACTLALALLPGTALANLVVNPSFETGPAPGGEFVSVPMGSTAITGWRVTQSAIDYCETRWDAADGARSLALNGSAPGGIEQTFDTVPSATYNVTFYMAGDPFSNPWIMNMRVAADGQFQDYVFNAEHGWPWGMGWVSNTFVFVADDETATLQFTSLDNGATGPALDNVSVTGPSANVPDSGLGFVLAAPRPNPAPRELTVSFLLPYEAPIRLAVLDVRGREIAVLADGVHGAGPHTRTWNGATPSGRAAGGLYFIRLTGPGTSRVQKAVLGL